MCLASLLCSHRDHVGSVFDPQSWVSAGRRGALMHLCRADAVGPVCSWRQKLKNGVFKGKALRFDSLSEAVSADRPFCTACVFLLPEHLKSQVVSAQEIKKRTEARACYPSMSASRKERQRCF